MQNEGANGQWRILPDGKVGGGGLVSTIDDHLAFGQMMVNKGQYGNERILSRPTVELMTADQLQIYACRNL